MTPTLGRIDIHRIQMMALARWRADRKWIARRSYRVAMRLKCLSLLKKRSMRLRILYARASWGMGRFLAEIEGITAFAPALSMIARMKSLSKARSAITPLGDRPLSSSGAVMLSGACPPVMMKSNGRPSASTRAWILVVSPPRERPRAWSLAPLFRSLPADGREPGWYRA
jgi:hypothetical protein